MCLRPLADPDADPPSKSLQPGEGGVTDRLTIYLAGRYSRREELCGYRSDLEARGHSVPARWLHGEHQVHGLEAAKAVERNGPVPVDEAVLFATDDVEDLLNSDVVVSFTERPRSDASRGGRHVEFGIALGLRRSGDQVRRLFVVGPLENVFHALPEVDGAFDTWEGFLAHLDAQPDMHGWDIPGNSRCPAHPWHMSTRWHQRAWPNVDDPRMASR
jgi:hypothetical protein